LGGSFGASTGERNATVADRWDWLPATALQHDLAVATRNVKDFVGLGVEILNPWETE
jgi:predicted nucleic acid-binding protein